MRNTRESQQRKSYHQIRDLFLHNDNNSNKENTRC